MGTTKQALGYMLRDVEMKIGKFAGKTVTVATARARGHVSFMRFCDMVAGHTTFNYMEVAAILNLAADTARSLVAGGGVPTLINVPLMGLLYVQIKV